MKPLKFFFIAATASFFIFLASQGCSSRKIAAQGQSASGGATFSPVYDAFGDIDCRAPGMEQYQECEQVENSSELDDEEGSDPNDCTRGIDEANQEVCQK